MDDRASPCEAFIIAAYISGVSSSNRHIGTTAEGSADQLAPGEPIGDKFIPDFAVEFDGEREVEPFRNEVDGLVPLSRQ